MKNTPVRKSGCHSSSSKQKIEGGADYRGDDKAVGFNDLNEDRTIYLGREETTYLFQNNLNCRSQKKQ
jgi:hypothetical protein